MSFELLYTSAPKGLSAGSRGFCTVVCTQGMPAPLMAALESLSAYRHIYPAGDRHAAKNPVAWSHLKMNVAGRAYHVLSRIADFGLDYSQRGNKLAHHVALEAAEQTSGGPAFLLAQPGAMETEWDGQPRLLPAGRQLRAGSQPPAVCAAWQALTGDAGWAGVLAESFLTNPNRQIYIVFKPGMDLLPLMTEAIALLPAESRWDVTFSTYFTSLPPGVTCGWRGVLSGSPEAEQGKKFGKALHIDLCQPVPLAKGGALVQAARTGRAAPTTGNGPQFATAAADSTGSEPDGEWELRPTAEEGVVNFASGTGVQFSESAPAAGAGYDVARPPGRPPPPPPANHDHKRRMQADLNAADAARARKRNRQIIGGVVLLLLCLGVAVFAVPAAREWARQRFSPLISSDDTAADNAKPDRAGRNKKPRPASDDDDATEPAAADEVARTRNSRDGSADEIERPGKASSDDDVSLKSPATAAETEGKAAANKTPPDDHPARGPDGEKPDVAQQPEAPKKTDANKHDSSRQNPAPTHPRLGNRDLTTVRDEHDYSLFAISLEDAIRDDHELKIPMRDAKTSMWELFAPVGRSEIKFKQKSDETKVAAIPKEEGVGSNLVEVLSVTRSYDHNGCTFRFDKLAEGWERIKWCLLSVSSPNGRTRVFALKEPTLKPGNGQFDAFKYSLRLADNGSAEAIPTIFVDSVDIDFAEADQRVRFDDPTEGFLSCVIPPALAGKMLFAESDRRLEMKLTQAMERATVAMALFPQTLNKIFEKS
ncbi:MAG TPA: hypothetical protein VGH74_08440, partial [Planctomycetaceae bacterium]